MAIISEIIAEIERLSQALAEDDSRLQASLGVDSSLGLMMGEPSTQEYVAQSELLDGPLKEYLNSIPERQLRWIETLMYFGRDPESVHDNDLNSLHQHIKGTSATMERAVDTIIEKTPRAEYLRNAQEKAAKLGIDIEKVLD